MSLFHKIIKGGERATLAVNVKDNLFLRLSKLPRHDGEWACEGMVPCIPKLGTTWRGVFMLTLLPL